MFTGIIEQQGNVIAKPDASNRLTIESSYEDIQTGESFSVNGVCLTQLTQQNPLTFDVSPETLRLTTLGQLQVQDKVNLERSMQASSRFGGHYVSGHVHTTATIQGIVSFQNYIEVTISGFRLSDRRYLVPKGSITLDGVSLTINTVHEEKVSIMLVPHTLAQTTLGQMKTGSRVNVEFDYLTRIVAHQFAISGQLQGED